MGVVIAQDERFGQGEGCNLLDQLDGFIAKISDKQGQVGLKLLEELIILGLPETMNVPNHC